MIRFILLFSFSSLVMAQEQWGNWNETLPESTGRFSNVKEFEAFLNRPERKSKTPGESAIEHWIDVTTGRESSTKSNEDLLDELAQSIEEADEIYEFEDIEERLDELYEEIEDELDEELDDELDNELMS